MKLDKIDYALIDRRVLGPLCIRFVKKKGDSFDRDANDLWHQDMEELSGSKLLDLACSLQAHAEFERLHKNHVRHPINASIRQGFIDPNQLEDKLRNDLGPLE